MGTQMGAGLVVGLVVACLVGAAVWLLQPVAPPRVAAVPPWRRRVLGAVRTRPPHESADPPAVAVARAASEVAALLRAGAVPAAAWAPQLLDGGAGDPSSSSSFPSSCRGPGQVRLALDAAARAASLGEDPAAALRRGHSRRSASGPALDSLALAWRTSQVTGAPAAAVLDGLAGALRDEAEAQDARDAALAGPRATARLLLALPGLGLAAATALGADPVGALLQTTAGRWCAAFGVLFALVGWGWTALLVRAAENAVSAR
ncbi:type II secretion system F family protein [Quadrisphaera granulorum]|nr:type II secretion system F family protein [Quadrisphaera granulorum]